MKSLNFFFLKKIIIITTFSISTITFHSRLAYHRLDELLSPQRNYSKLTVHLESLPRDVPVLPYLGLHLKELAMIHAGNPTFLDEGKKKKVRMQGSGKTTNMSMF